jgi:hypothetical protein
MVFHYKSFSDFKDLPHFQKLNIGEFLSGQLYSFCYQSGL